ncbi:acetoin utilization transport system ATP-binding protein [Gracilibacillus orientalis]|uniref:Acetoin utilization transport system ATP-binding protein n=1 Tax=Gracilibacillus orientalis TaxID=334253 RepID=A0A1I4PPU1_9BACI|nr:ABC transporter ATP-binding protein [Gracilibacillus orientalis]SFM29606.1 acetoin utilization transport system ATP-binding protein [Gracilibacillus orientalis]
MIEAKDINHTFLLGKKQNETALQVLTNISFSVAKGDILAITGKSGSGKSALLNIIAGFMKPTSGSVWVKEKNVTNFSEGEFADFRLDNIGFIFQNFQLIPSMTAYENIELPLVLKGLPEKERKERTEQTLEKVGLSNYHQHYPSELSGGQQQRVSIARTLVIEPPIILADEPTGSLDSETEQEVLDLITGLNKDLGITFLMITHDEEVARIASKKIHIHDGEIVKEEVSA